MGLFSISWHHVETKVSRAPKDNVAALRLDIYVYIYIYICMYTRIYGHRVYVLVYIQQYGIRNHFGSRLPERQPSLRLLIM
jgi:hypothetical protein